CTLQQDVHGIVFWSFNCWAPGQSLCDTFIQARMDDRKIYNLDLAGLYRAPHAPFDEIVSPSHRRTAPR
ncbi:hypothetical protein AVEN_186912-1, partial [Araneus ventricosus]